MPLPFTGSFVTPAEMYPADRQQFAIENSSGAFIAFTTDRGDSFTNVASNLSGITAMGWAGDGSVLYATDGVSFSSCANVAAVLTCTPVTATTPIPSDGSSIRHIAVDPSDPMTILAITTRFGVLIPTVFRSVDGGVVWTDITVTGSPVATADTGGAVAYMSTGGTNPDYMMLVGINEGVLVEDGGPGNGWKLLAAGMPTVPILDMVYEETDDIVVIATLGRGVWFLANARRALTDSSAQPSNFFQSINSPESATDYFGSIKKPLTSDVSLSAPDDFPDTSTFTPIP